MVMGAADEFPKLPQFTKNLHQTSGDNVITPKTNTTPKSVTLDISEVNNVELGKTPSTVWKKIAKNTDTPPHDSDHTLQQMQTPSSSNFL